MDIRSALEKEIKMTMGCTDPGAVAYAAAKASSLLKGELTEIDVLLSKNIYKNAVNVCIPAIKKSGIGYAAVLGALAKKPELKLAVLSEVGEEILDCLEDSMKKIKVSVECLESVDILHISVTCRSSISAVNVVIKGDYDRISRIETDGRTVYENEPMDQEENNLFASLRFGDIYREAIESDTDASFLLQYEEINKKASLYGSQGNTRLSALGTSQRASTDIWKIAHLARMNVINASRMRMMGESVPIASLAGSGNLGILSFLAVSSAADELDTDQEKRIRALYLSALITVYIKSYMNRLTVMCGTAVAGAAGGAAATAYLLGGGQAEVECAVNTVLGSIGGILCDGAKESCSLKVGFAAECAVTSGYLALNHKGINAGKGIISDDIDTNIRNIGIINNQGMKEADSLMIKIISEMSEKFRIA